MTYDAEDLASELSQYHDRYFGRTMNPIYQMWLRNSYAYYSTVLDTQTWMTSLRFEGDQGELVKMSIPQSRSLIRQLLTLITKQKLAFNAIAEVQKSDVTEEVRIANAVCQQIIKDQSVDLKQENMVEDGLVLGTGFMGALWRTDKGRPRAVSEDDDGKKNVVYEGDIEIVVPDVRDMLYDFLISSWDEKDWLEVRFKKNRWTLLAQHPELETEILALPSISQDDRIRDAYTVHNDDMVWVYELYHKPTPALPRGRMMFYSNSRTVYADDENRYGCIPFEQFKPEPIKGLGFGYPMLSNLLPAQEMYDHDLSAIATNHSALGVQNVTAPRGADINVQEILGMNFIAYTPQDVPGGGKPEPLQLVSSSPELFKLPEVLLSNMQQMSNINAAVRGELPGGTSGVAIATLTTNALEFLSSYSKSTQDVLERIMMHSINGYRRFAKTERMVRLTGKNYQAFSKPFTGSSLEPITSIKIQSVNPLLMTMAGRIEIADKSIEKGLVKNMQEYASILDGEPLSRLFETELSQNDLIQSENEMMTEGETVIAVSIDDHALHIFKHKTMLNDPRIRKDSQRVQMILAHIEEHNRLASTTAPFLQAMANTGRMPEGGPPQQQMPPPPGADIGGEAPVPGPSGEEQATGSMAAQPAEPAEDLLGRRGA